MSSLQALGPLLPTDPPAPVQILPNASGANINNSQFTVHHGDYITINQSPPLARRPTGSQTDHEVILCSEYEVLCNSLFLAQRGRPLLQPTQENSDYPTEYQERGISIGDVGSISIAGGFDFDFNLYLDGDHPINSPDRAPHNFQAAPNASITSNRNAFPEGSHITSVDTVEGIQVKASLGASSDFALHFNCVGPDGAFVALPKGSAVHQLKNIEGLRKYLIQHGHSWYTHLTEVIGRQLEGDSFYVVTGCEKSHVGGIGTFQVSKQRQFQITFAPEIDSSGSPTSIYSFSPGHPARTRVFNSSFEAEPRHTVFIQGFRVTRRSRSRQFLRKTQSVFIPIDDSILMHGNASRVSGSIPASPSWLFSFKNSKFSSTNDQLSAANPVDIEDDPPISKMLDLSAIINEHLLEIADPDTEMAITHEYDWMDTITNNSSFTSQEQFLQAIMSNHCIVNDSGFVYLAKDPGSLLEHVHQINPDSRTLSHVAGHLNAATSPFFPTMPQPSRLPSLNQLAASISAHGPNGAAAPAAPAALVKPANRTRLSQLALRTNSTAPLSTTASTNDSTAVNPPTTRPVFPSAGTSASRSRTPSNEMMPGGRDADLTSEKLEKLNLETTTLPATGTEKKRVGYKNIPSLNAITQRLAKTCAFSIDGNAKPPELEMIEDPKMPGFSMKASEHPLEYNWTIYHDTKAKVPFTPALAHPNPAPSPAPNSETFLSADTETGDYEAGLTVVGEFSTVEEFCRYFNWLKPPSHLERNSNYHLFKSGIKPMWEDEANANGGKWVLTMKNNPQLLDRCWNWLAMALVGEELEEGQDLICGAVVSLRSKVDRIQVWTRIKDDVERLNAIGKKLVKLLNVSEADGIGLEFQFNTDDRPLHNKFLSIQSMPMMSYQPMFQPGTGRMGGGHIRTESVGANGSPYTPVEPNNVPASAGPGGAFGSFGIGIGGTAAWRAKSRQGA